MIVSLKENTGRAELLFDTVIVSDWHLGRFYCRDKALLRFLSNLQCRRLIVDGDGIDLIEMNQVDLPRPGKNFVKELERKASLILPHSHYLVLRRMQQMVQSGVQVDWIWGNHDIPFKNHAGETFFGAKLAQSVTIDLPGGKKMLVVHGDEFDMSFRKNSLSEKILELSYFTNLWVDIALNAVSEAIGIPPLSMPKFARRDLGIGTQILNSFRERVTRHAIDQGADIIVCGHIHEPEDSIAGDVRRINSGDFTESCSGVVIDSQGQVSVIQLPLYTPQAPFTRLRADALRHRKIPTLPCALSKVMRDRERVKTA